MRKTIPSLIPLALRTALVLFVGVAGVDLARAQYDPVGPVSCTKPLPTIQLMSAENHCDTVWPASFLSYFDIVFTANAPALLDAVIDSNGHYLGWCLEVYRSVRENFDCPMAIYSSLLAPEIPSQTPYPPIQQVHWNQINWILNHKGTYPWQVVQLAMWRVLDPNFDPRAQPAYPYKCSSTLTDDDIKAAQALRDQATLYYSYLPGPGEEYAIILVSVDSTDCTKRSQTLDADTQVMFIEAVRPPLPPLRRGDTATIGFWQNKNGQALINSLNGGNGSMKLANWLAYNFPCLFGTYAANNPPLKTLAGMTNAGVAAFFVDLFKVKGQKTYAQVLGAALACYVTDSTLAGTAAAKYGFNVSSLGTGAKF